MNNQPKEPLHNLKARNFMPYKSMAYKDISVISGVIQAIPKLFLPSFDEAGDSVEIAHNGLVVLVGANESGKIRIGAWIETINK